MSYTAHGESRLLSRNVTEDQIRETLELPHTLYQNEGKFVAERFDEGWTLRVEYIERITELGTDARVISVIRMRGNRMKEGR